LHATQTGILSYYMQLAW